MQDSFNLCWKLALVLKGKASQSLLDSYQEERAPIAKQIVDRANKSIADTAPIFQALGLENTLDVDEMKKNMEKRKEPTTEAEKQREDLRNAILYKSYEFNCHGVELNQRYTSAAIVPDDTPAPSYLRDSELYYQPSTRPGSRLPHVWLGKNKEKISTLDLAGKGAFTLFTGIGGDNWIVAATLLSEELQIPIRTVTIGPGKAYTDLYGDWAGVREIADTGCLLVRPDFHIAFRATNADGDITGQLRTVCNAILGKS